MHILHLVQLYRPVPSGASQYFVEIGERLVRDGHQVTVLTTDAFDLEHLWAAGRKCLSDREDHHNGVRVLRFPVQRVRGSHLLYPAIRRLMVEIGRLPLPPSAQLPLLRRLACVTPRIPALERFLNSPNLDNVSLVHSTNITLDFALLPLVAWAQQRGIPHMCTPFVHLGEPENDTIRRYYTMPHQLDLLRNSAAVITQTSLEQQYLAQAGIPAAQMQTIGVGVTPRTLEGGRGERFRLEHEVADGPIVLTVGVAAYDKGTIHVIEAMQRLWEKGVTATWVQIGPLMEHVEQYINALPEEQRARMRVLGYVSDRVRRDALAVADVFVLPSRTDSFGIAYLEAWVYGVPVIGARAGGVPEVIDDGKDGVLVGFGDVDALSHAIEVLLTEQLQALEMGVAGRTKVMRTMTWDHVYSRVHECYTDVLARATCDDDEPL
jgi:glycosyltransferase involved in cell wall biosynthesis